MTNAKLEKLDRILKDLHSFIVAFSGGVDSSFLVYRAHSLKKPDMMSVTIKTPYIPQKEIIEATEFARKSGIRHEILDLDFPDDIKSNPVDRCYLCKRTIFTALKAHAMENGFRHVIDGTNADDTGDFRPGIRALKELGIRSPLLEAGLTKNDIREIAHKEGLSIWDKAANACLLTRIPYNTEVKDNILKMIEEAEYMLLEKGCPGVRVRVHGDLARIECLPGFMDKIVNNPEKNHIINDLKKIGFRYVTLDLEGYRTGSSNPENIIL